MQPMLNGLPLTDYTYLVNSSQVYSTPVTLQGSYPYLGNPSHLYSNPAPSHANYLPYDAHSRIPRTFSMGSSSTSSSDSEEEIKENLGTPRNFKTSLCTHFTSGRRCPRGEYCSFAHGQHELRPLRPATTYCPPRQPNSSYKIELCQNFTVNGSGVCKYGLACQFIHPEDGEAYQYKKGQELHGIECQRLYKLRDAHRGNLAMEQHIEGQINAKVIQRNIDHPKRANYYDLHHMTLSGADTYIASIIHFMIANKISVSWIETGKGNHSMGGVSKIKKLIAEKYEGYCGATFVPEMDNEGILVLTIF